MGSRLAFAAALCVLVMALIFVWRPGETPDPSSKPETKAGNLDHYAGPSATQSDSAAPAPAAQIAAAVPEPTARANSPETSRPATSAPAATPLTAVLNTSDLDEPKTSEGAAQTASAIPSTSVAPTASRASAAPPAEASPLPKPAPEKKKEEAPRVSPAPKPTPKPSPSATPSPRAATATAMGKIRLRGYDWVRGQDDHSIYVKLKLFNGSSSHIRRVRLACAAYSDGLVRLQSVGKSLDTSISPGSTANLRHINLGRLHKNTARVSCSVEAVEIQ